MRAKRPPRLPLAPRRIKKYTSFAFRLDLSPPIELLSEGAPRRALLTSS